MVVRKEAVDLGIVLGGEAQPAAGEADEQVAGYWLLWCAALVDFDDGVEAEFSKYVHNVTGRGLERSLDTMEVEPEIVEWALRVGTGDLHHDASLRMLGEITDELLDRCDVVDDVVCGDDGVHARLGRDLGPTPVNRSMGHSGPGCLLVELVEHGGADVESGDHRRDRREREAGRTAATSDVQQRATAAEAGEGLASC